MAHIDQKTAYDKLKPIDKTKQGSMINDSYINKVEEQRSQAVKEAPDQAPITNESRLKIINQMFKDINNQ